MGASSTSGRATPPRVYLDVPFSEKDQAKQAGARWDPKVRRWYDPRPETAALQRWAARADVPELLPGEDRAFGDGLFVDLVPRSCWFTNVRSCVADIDWERLRRPVLHRAGHRCEACQALEDRRGGRGLDVHERWHYDQQTGVQVLRRLVALCTSCHQTTHYGLAQVTGRAEEAFAHLRAVTGMTDLQADAHIADALHAWAVRSQRVWELDLRILTDAGIGVRRPPAAAERADVAERELNHARTAVDPAPVVPRPPPARPRPVAPPPVTAPSRSKPIPDATPADIGLAEVLAGTAWHGGSDDLAGNAAGIGVTHEAARRRQLEGLGADRSWRLGADGEAAVGQVLASLTTPSRLDRLRGRAPAWRVLHSVPVGTGRGDIDHVLIGPPGVVTINTKHHQKGRLALDGDELVVNGRPTDYIPKARREAQRAAELLGTALAAVGRDDLAGRLRVRPVLAIVGGRVLITAWAPDVPVVMTRDLPHTLASMFPVLNPAQVEAIYSVARHRRTWTRSLE